MVQLILYPTFMMFPLSASSFSLYLGLYSMIGEICYLGAYLDNGEYRW